MNTDLIKMLSHKKVIESVTFINLSLNYLLVINGYISLIIAYK
jgi:hypothetical protein